MRHIRLFVVISSVALLMYAPLASAQKNDTVHISGFKSSSTTEYVTISNTSEAPQDITGWKIEYSNASGSNIRTIASLAGELLVGQSLHFGSPNFLAQFTAPEGTVYTPMEYSGLADSGGFIRLFSSTADIENYPNGLVLEDTVGWTTSSSMASQEIIVVESGLFYLRCTDTTGNLVVRGDNRLDFLGSLLPHGSAEGNVCPDLVEVPDDPPPDEEEPDDDDSEPTPPVNRCDGIVINEVLPNPSGTDSGREFIELFNTTQLPIALAGCRLSIATATAYTFPAGSLLEAGDYLVIDDVTLGFTLVNSQSLAVYLLSEDNAEMTSVTYPANLEDDQSYALFEDTYASTYSATPGAENISTPDKPCVEGYQRSTVTGRCNKIQSAVSVDSPLCEAGYERNPETNRCRKIPASAAACPSGQQRNPATNRCVKIPTTAVLSACDDGQERNSETNRCRKINTGTELLPCAPGQERNPDTNRCRMVLASSMSDDKVGVVDVPAEQNNAAIPIGMITVSSLGYIFYEWRREVLEQLARLFGLLTRR